MITASRSLSKPARVRSISASASVAWLRFVSASVRICCAVVRRCSIIAATGRQKNRASSQIRIMTLTAWIPSVHQSTVMASFQQWVGEQQKKRDHQAVDRHGLDHRKPDEQRARDGIRGFGLAGDCVHGGGHCASLGKCRADRAKRDRYGGRYDADES